MTAENEDDRDIEEQAKDIVKDLIHKHPEMMLDLLRAAGEDIPEGTHIEAIPIDWEEVIPMECDSAGIVYFKRGKELELACGIELVFATGDPETRWGWPAALSWLLAEYQSAGGLVIIAPDPEVARWAAQPIEDESFSMKPRVLGPDHLHLLSDDARRSLETLAAKYTEPSAFDPDDVAGFLRLVVGDDNASGIRTFLNSGSRDLPDDLAASFTVRGRGPLRTHRV